MRKRFARLIAVSAMLLKSFSLLAAPPTAPTIEQLAAFPEYSSFTLSPDGEHLAALRSNGEERVIAVWATDATDQAPTLIGASRMKIQYVQFIKNDRLAVGLWQPHEIRVGRLTRTFLSKLMITDLKGTQWHEPMPSARAKSDADKLRQALSSAQVLDILPNDPHHILAIESSGSNAGDIYRVDLRDYSAERIQMSDDKTSGYITDMDGQLRARLKADVDGIGAYIAAEIRDHRTGQWDEHFRSYVKNRDQTQIVRFSADPNIAFISSNEGQDKSVLYEYDIAARKRKEILFEHRFFNAGSVIINPYKQAPAAPSGILGVSYLGPRGDDVQWTDPGMLAIDAGLRQALDLHDEKLRIVDPASGQSATIDYPLERDYRIVDFTPDMRTLLLNVSGASAPPQYYLFRNGELTLLSSSYAAIDPRTLGDTRLVYYTARDGLNIPAFLTTPSTEMCGPGPWKAVIHPHGGPWARDDMGFDASMWTPLMASRCMAVLRPQYRGSADWGRKLWMAGDAEWGQKMQDDKDDGAKWLIEQKIAMPGHIALFGFSYGGYAAFAAAVRPEGIYKCAIAGAGVSDIKKIWSRYYTNAFFREAQAPTVDGLNPLEHAGQIKIPLMIYHGDRDQTVPIEQSEWFASKAKASGQPVEYHAIADYAHGPAWTRAIMGDQLRFIETYLINGCGGSGL